LFFFLVLERPISFELDTLTLSFNGSQTVPVTNLGIAWTTDKAVKFNNPPNPPKCRYKKNFFFYKKINFIWIVFAENPRPPNWQYTAWDLGGINNTDNNGYQNEDFIVWMRTAAMPTFRKLYRKLNSTNSTNSTTFQTGLPIGNYTLTINYSKIFLYY